MGIIFKTPTDCACAVGNAIKISYPYINCLCKEVQCLNPP